jgi:hypothetical protein
MVKKFFYFSLAIIIVISIYLSLFEVLLYYFHSPLTHSIEDPLKQQATWTYLLHQKYLSFIEIDAYTIHEKRHLLDVKRFFEKVHIVWITFTFFSLIILPIFFKHLIKIIIYLGITINTLFILFSLNFINSFDFLHTLLFTKNSWVFNKESKLIEYFPLIYFQEFFILFLGLSSLFFTFIYWLKVYPIK